MPQPRRSRLEVCLDILSALARGPMGPTRLSLEANLNYPSLKEHLRLLVSRGLVEEAEGGRRYCITERGLRALGYFAKLKEALGLEGPRAAEAASGVLQLR